MLSLNEFRRQQPLVDCITNNVTVNFVANVLLASGASPVMAEEPAEIDEFVGISSAVALNIGTAFTQYIPHFTAALESAARHGRPVVLDPVGAGASRFRIQLVRQLLTQGGIGVIRGNASEIRALMNTGELNAKGVDAGSEDRVDENTLPRHIELAKAVARCYRCVVAQSGAIDVITDGQRVFLCRNGVPQMSQITGTGCALGALNAAWCGAFPGQLLEASATAYAMMGLAGERAWQYCQQHQGGCGMMAMRLIDELSLMDEVRLEQEGKLEEA